MRRIPLLALVALASPAVAQNLIANSGFEDGYLDPWITGFLGTNEGQISGGNAHSGNYTLFMPAYASSVVVPSIVEQSFDVTEGRLRLSFWGYSDSDIKDRAFGVMLSGPDGTGPDVFMNVKAGWNLYTYEVPSDSDLTRFSYLRLTSWTGNPESVFYAHIDDVVLEPVPEPASLAALALGSLALMRRRRSNAG